MWVTLIASRLKDTSGTLIRGRERQNYGGGSEKSQSLALRMPSRIRTPKDFNTHYASISTDLDYKSPLLKLSAFDSNVRVTDSEIFFHLDHLHHTATGYDGIPSWFLRLAAPALCSILSHLINLSLSQYHVPDQWKTSIIFPMPKIPNPQSPSDFRPISITPVLSRLLERIIVSTYIYPSLNQPPISSLISDQFAFRPTDSTTSAIISINHHAPSLLTTNPYVSLFSLDFTKAFDSVRHDALSQKLASLNIPDEIYNWLVTFLNGRSHVTHYAGLASSIAYYNASVVQGSVIGLSSYDILASDLRPLSRQNIY